MFLNVKCCLTSEFRDELSIIVNGISNLLPKICTNCGSSVVFSLQEALE